MSKIFQLEGGQYEHPNEYKLVSTIRGTTILQPEFGTVIIEGDVIEASTHNTIQKNGVLASKVNVTMESTDTVLVPTDMAIELDLFNELKIMLLFETGTTLPSNSFIKLKDTNIPIANVNDYVVNANTPLLFLYFDSKFYAYKAGEGASTGAESLGDLSDVTLTSPTSGQALVYNGTKFVNKTVEEPESLGDLSDVTLTSPTSGQALVYNGTKFVNQTISGDGGVNFVKLTQLATESIAGIIKISTTAQVSAGTDNSTAVSPAKLKSLFSGGSNMSTNGYQKLPSGLIIQWGQASYPAPLSTPGAATSLNVTFPVAFTTKLLSVTFSGLFAANGDDGLECMHTLEASTKTSMIFRSTRLVGSPTAGEYGNAYWIAIGY